MRAARAWAWLFVLVLVAVVATSAVSFGQLQSEQGELEPHPLVGASIRSPRFVGYRLTRRPETSLVELATLEQRSNDLLNLSYGIRRGYYEMQAWFSGHAAVGPVDPPLHESGWHESALVPLRLDPDAPQLRPTAGFVLSPMVAREVDVIRALYAFLFDPAEPDALAPGERLLLLPDPNRARRVFVTSDSRLHEIEPFLR